MQGTAGFCAHLAELGFMRIKWSLKTSEQRKQSAMVAVQIQTNTPNKCGGAKVWKGSASQAGPR